jgi:hypothetical protein
MVLSRQLARMAIALAAVASLTTGVAIGQPANTGTETFSVRCHFPTPPSLIPDHTLVEWKNTQGVKTVRFHWKLSFGFLRGYSEEQVPLSSAEISGNRQVRTPRAGRSVVDEVEVVLEGPSGARIATLEAPCLP